MAATGKRRTKTGKPGSDPQGLTLSAHLLTVMRGTNPAADEQKGSDPAGQTLVYRFKKKTKFVTPDKFCQPTQTNLVNRIFLQVDRREFIKTALGTGFAAAVLMSTLMPRTNAAKDGWQRALAWFRANGVA